ncbi:MAG: RloB family protein [Saprospiraceae bacterium]|nr:RloB family protein [Saprospiraceae bacterium]
MSEIPPFIRLVCEGSKTEPNYFNQWLRSKGIRQPNPAFKPKDHSPLGVAREAKKIWQEAVRIKIPAEKIFVFAVFDRDGHAKVPEAIDMLQHTPIKVIFSNVCFEYWFLLHYERTSKPFATCGEIISYIRQHHDPDYGKANDHFARIGDRVSIAVANAEWLKNSHWQHDDRSEWLLNPFTNVHEVINMKF